MFMNTNIDPVGAGFAGGMLLVIVLSRFGDTVPERLSNVYERYDILFSTNVFNGKFIFFKFKFVYILISQTLF